jgi:hypothetical protein
VSLVSDASTFSNVVSERMFAEADRHCDVSVLSAICRTSDITVDRLLSSMFVFDC